jgi:hypothetical protein
MPRAGIIVAVAVLLALAACANFDPYATTPLPVAEGVKEAGPRVAICYNAMRTSKARVFEMAQQECAAGRVATPVVTDWHVQYCPLLVPARANFVCAPKA